MKIALVCPASLPATQFGGIVFLAVDLAQEISEMGHNVTIYTTDLDFSNGPNKFNKKLPRIEKFEKFLINRTHVWFSLKLFFVNTSMSKEIENDKQIFWVCPLIKESQKLDYSAAVKKYNFLSKKSIIF